MQQQHRLATAFIHIVHARPVDHRVMWRERIAWQIAESILGKCLLIW